MANKKNATGSTGKPSDGTFRCAIYTRKSTEEGLDQAFNSLDAQREACHAFITSQKHEGWAALPAHYDDGGYSGGNMDRPALKQLLEDIAAGKINIVVVYKIDRLTRSLADFAKIIDVLDKNGASFVSVTQAFNTTTSMGRLTLNVLLSFAQFEREVTAERIRDKIAASRAKGMWMGGSVPLGYDAVDKKLVVNSEDAETVRAIFRRYLELGSVPKLTAELKRQGVRSKMRESKNGRRNDGFVFSTGAVRAMLMNPVYIGLARHKDACHPGQHEAIMDKELWDTVQQRMDRNRVDRQESPPGKESSPLAGKIFDETGERLTPSHSGTQMRRHRYYVSQSLINGTIADRTTGGWRLPAHEIETATAVAASKLLSDQRAVTDAVRNAGIADGHIPLILSAAANLCEQLKSTQEQGAALRRLVTHVEIKSDRLTITLNLKILLRDIAVTAIENPEALSITRPVPMQLRRRGLEMRLVIEPGGSSPPGKTDPALLKAVARARSWFLELATSKEKSITRIAKREGLHPRYVNRQIPLAFLAPEIVKAILEGRQPADLTLQRLTFGTSIPFDWTEQTEQLGN